MRQRILLGQSLVVVGLLLLLPAVAWLPVRYGLPETRALEMTVFWGSMVLVAIGQGIVRHSWDRVGGPAGVLAGARAALMVAALGGLVAAAVCLLALSNMNYSTLWGAGWLRLGNSMYLYSRPVGYLLALPLVGALAVQVLPLVAGEPPGGGFARRTRIGAGWILLGGLASALGLLFALLLVGSAAARMAGAGAVVVTWIAGCLFVLASAGNLAWALRPAALAIPSLAPPGANRT